MLVFLHAFFLALAAISLLGGSIMLWTFGLLKPAEVLTDRGHLNLGGCYIVGYFLVTIATVAGVIAVVAGVA